MIRDTLEDAYWHLMQAHLKLREIKHLDSGSHAQYLLTIANDIQTDIDSMDSVAARMAEDARREAMEYYWSTR